MAGKRITELSIHSGTLGTYWIVGQDENQTTATRRLATDLAGTGGGASSASAISFSPTGAIAATNVQAAIAEVDTEKVPTSRTISTSAGLAGGGALSGNLTLSLDVAALSLLSGTAVDSANDMLLLYDASAAGYVKVAPNSLPAGTGTTFAIAVSIPSPTASTYTVVRAPGFAFTINSLVHINNAGTLTAAVQINGVAVTGLSAVAVTSAETTTNATGSNTVATTARVQIVLSSVTGVGEVNFTLRCTRS